MIRDGELDKTLNNFKCWNRIHSGGLIKDMMANYGISIIIELIWSKL